MFGRGAGSKMRPRAERFRRNGAISVGLFKDMKNMVNQAGAITAQAQQMQQAAMAQQAAANAPVDLNDPMWAPIEGVSLDQYAKISAGLVRDGVAGIEAVEAYAESHGVPSGKWQAVQTGWVARMGQHMEVRTRYGNLYAQA